MQTKLQIPSAQSKSYNWTTKVAAAHNKQNIHILMSIYRIYTPAKRDILHRSCCSLAVKCLILLYNYIVSVRCCGSTRDFPKT